MLSSLFYLSMYANVVILASDVAKKDIDNYDVL